MGKCRDALANSISKRPTDTDDVDVPKLMKVPERGSTPERRSAVDAGVVASARPERENRVWQWVWRLSGIVVAIAITVAVYLFRDRLRDVASYGYLGLFLISIVGNATIVLPVPTFVTAFLGGGFYNPVLVGVISAAGATLGELTGYLAGLSGKALIDQQEVYERFNRWMERYGLFALFVLAAIPNPFFDVAGIIAGMARMRLTTYLPVVWAGKVVKFILIAYLGAGSVDLFESLIGS